MTDVGKLQWLVSAAGEALKRNERGDAFAYLEQARALAQGQPGALNYISQLYAQANRPAVAAEILSQLTQQFPDDPTLLFNLAQMWRKADRFEEAAKTFKRVYELKPEDSEARILWAIECARSRDYDQAMAVLRDAISDGVEVINSQYLLASFLEMKGRSEEAEVVVDAVLAEVEGHIGANCIKAKLERRAGDTQAAMARLEALSPMPAGDPLTASAEYELTRLYDGERSPKKAMQACERAAQSVFARVPDARLRAAEYRRRLAYLLDVYTADWRAAWESREYSGPAPVFLVGFPRSGTTLLDQVLDGHSDFQVMEERDALASVIERVETMQGGYPGALAKISQTRLDALRNHYWERVNREFSLQPGQRLVDKLPLSAIHLGLINRLFPNAQIILALRHPLDAVLSCYMQYFGINDGMANFLSPEDSVATYDLVMQLVVRYRELFDLNLIEVRYEDVVADLEAQIRRLLEFLGAPFDEKILAFHQHSQRRGAINTPSYDQVNRPLYSEARYRWRRYRSVVRPWQSVLAPWIERYGYQSERSA